MSYKAFTSKMKFKTEIITFGDIQPIWEKQLWPNRQSPIKPMSSKKKTK